MAGTVHVYHGYAQPDAVRILRLRQSGMRVVRYTADGGGAKGERPLRAVFSRRSAYYHSFLFSRVHDGSFGIYAVCERLRVGEGNAACHRKDAGIFPFPFGRRRVVQDGKREGIWHFYEWAGALDGAFFELDGSKKYRNEYDSLINAFLSIALDNTAKLFSVTGEYDKAIYYQDIRIKLNKSLKEKFYSPETGLFRTYSDREEYSELSNALCVLAEACSDEEAKAIVEKLAVGYDGWVRNTLSMSIFRYDALLKTDREKYVPAILKDIDETYGYMLDNGATSFWETIKGEADFHNAGSLCHGWSALPVYYYRIFGLCGEREKPSARRFPYGISPPGRRMRPPFRRM